MTWLSILMRQPLILASNILPSSCPCPCIMSRPRTEYPEGQDILGRILLLCQPHLNPLFIKQLLPLFRRSENPSSVTISIPSARATRTILCCTASTVPA